MLRFIQQFLNNKLQIVGSSSSAGGSRAGDSHPGASVQTRIFQVEGLHCASCVVMIDAALEDIEGVIESTTSLERTEVAVQFDPDRVQPAAIIAAIEASGYQVKS